MLHRNIILSLLVLTLIVAAGCAGQRTASQDTWGRADAKEIDVNSKIAGRVVELFVKEGDEVIAGQILAVIDERDLLAQKEQLQANILAIQAQQTQAAAVTEMQRGTTQSALEQAQALQRQAEVNLSLAREDFNRYSDLVTEGAISRQMFSQYDTRYKVAQADFNQAKAAVAQATAALAQTDVNVANQETLRRNLDRAVATLEQLEISLDECRIKAPFNGIITEKYIETGSMISQGTPLVAIQDPHDNWIDVKIKETELSNYKLGQVVDLIGRDNATKISGTIVDISRKAEFATQRATSERNDETDIVTFNVKIQVNSDLLRPGMRFKLIGDNNA